MKREVALSTANAAFLYVPILLWMTVIFYFSSVPGSGVEYEMPRTLLFERKGAHVFEYLVLTFLIARAFSFHLTGNVSRSLWLSSFFALAYAISDEAHQLFVFGRTGKVTDVLIDSIGIAIAVSIIFFFLKRKQKRT